jgi:hypothetical protein
LVLSKLPFFSFFCLKCNPFWTGQHSRAMSTRMKKVCFFVFHWYICALSF